MNVFAVRAAICCLAALGALDGCTEPAEGFLCSVKKTCPPGFTCAANARCYTAVPSWVGAGGSAGSVARSLDATNLDASAEGGSGGAIGADESGRSLGGYQPTSTISAGATQGFRITAGGETSVGGQSPEVTEHSALGGGSSNSSDSGSGGSGGSNLTTPEVLVSGCTAEEIAKLEQTVRYLANRASDGKLQLAECLNQSYLWGVESLIGASIVSALSALRIDEVNCVAGEDSSTFEGGFRLVDHTVAVSRERLDASDIKTLAGAMMHSALHAIGYVHDVADDDPHFANTVPEQGRACIEKWSGNAAADGGYSQWVQAALVAHKPDASFSDAATSCELAYRAAADKSSVECFFDGTRIAYELFFDGDGRMFRVGFEPTWTRTAALANYLQNITNFPSRRVDCRFNGKHMGYDLYFNSVRVGREVSFSREQAVFNCAWNIKAHPELKVDCTLDGDSLGFELFQDGKRVVLDPEMGIEKAGSDCQTFANGHPTSVVECRFDGAPL